jgi:RNA polymerase sigma-70 factor (ECF subfamily)
VNASTSASGPPSPPLSSAADARQRYFVTTHWSLVLAAGVGEAAEAHRALGELCQTYWYPLYVYIRRRGYSPEDAEDLTQGFFARLLERRWVGQADRARGRFRSFLLTALNHFLADDWDRAHAQKRGGGKILPLEIGPAESRYQLEPADRLTPEKIFERQWAMTVLESVYARLQAEYQAEDKAAQFDSLKDCLTQGRGAVRYAALSKQLDLSEGALRVMVCRLRQRYRQLLRDEIAQTVADPGAVEEELRYLFRALSQ